MNKDTIIEFPCYFPVKIIGLRSQSFVEEVKAIAGSHFPNFAPDDLRQKPSKNNNYLALTVTVFVRDQATLDEFYKALTKVAGVKMVL